MLSDSLCENPFMVRLGSPRTEKKSQNSITYPLALSLVKGFLKVFTVWRSAASRIFMIELRATMFQTKFNSSNALNGLDVWNLWNSL
jgi:hypothetical protein